MGHTFLYQGRAFKFNILSLAAVLTAIICLFIFPQAARADCPSCISHQYFGTVVKNGRPASEGYTVYAVVNGVQVASTTTDSKGQWGYDEPFIVSAPSGSFVEFYVSGEYVGKAASCIAGSSTRLDLMVSSATGPITSPITTDAGTNITASILGQADSLELSNGILVTAKKLSSADGGINLSFPANTAITTDGSLFSVNVQATPPLPPPGEKLIIAYGFSPDDFTANPAATVILKYDAASLPSAVDESSLYIAQWNGASWVPLLSAVNAAQKTVTAQMKSFSTIAILGKVNTPPPAQVIDSFILGTTDNLTLDNGVLTEGRDLESADGKISLDFAGNTTFNLQGGQQITALQMASPPSPPIGSGMIEAYSLGPDNSSFNPPLTLTIKYDTSELQSNMAESGLYVAAFNSSENWTALPSSVDVQRKVVTARIDHFSVYALLGAETTAEAPAAAAFTTSDLTVVPQTADAGESFTVSARLVNNSAVEGTREIILMVNNAEESRKEIALPGGASQTVNFTLARNEPGVYMVGIDNLTAAFTINAATPVKEQEAPPDIPLIVAIAFCGLLVIIFVIVQIGKQRTRY